MKLVKSRGGDQNGLVKIFEKSKCGPNSTNRVSACSGERALSDRPDSNGTTVEEHVLYRRSKVLLVIMLNLHLLHIME